MELKLAELLEMHSCEIEVREDYSGRGMYGKSTAAIVCDESNMFEAIAGIMESGDEEEREYVADNIRYGFKTDSMGYSTVYY
jgi:hypothetical protein